MTNRKTGIWHRIHLSFILAHKVCHVQSLIRIEMQRSSIEATVLLCMNYDSLSLHRRGYARDWCHGQTGKRRPSAGGGREGGRKIRPGGWRRSSWRAWSAGASRAGGGRRRAEVEAQGQAAAGGARRWRRTAAASPGGGSLTALVGDQEPGGVRRFVGFEGVGFGQEWLSPALLGSSFSTFGTGW